MPGIAGGKPLMWFAWTSGRGAGRVKTSDAAALPVQTGAGIRHARQGHPTGVWRTARSRGSPELPCV